MLAQVGSVYFCEVKKMDSPRAISGWLMFTYIVRLLYVCLYSSKLVKFSEDFLIFWLLTSYIQYTERPSGV